MRRAKIYRTPMQILGGGKQQEGWGEMSYKVRLERGGCLLSL